MKYVSVLIYQNINCSKMNQHNGTQHSSCLNPSIYGQKMALAAYATEHGDITMLNSHQLDIIRKLIVLLKPIEEVTKMISTNSACISAVIPLVKFLKRMFNKHDDDAGIRTMKSEKLTSLECRFDSIEQIDELCVATIIHDSNITFSWKQKHSNWLENFV